MHPSPIAAPNSPLCSAPGAATPERAERAYKGVTIAVMLLLLASLWLF
jgi:hypothetical protein